MTPDWKYRLYLFVRATDVTNTNKILLAGIYVLNGSGETLENELKMFDGSIKLSDGIIGLNLTATQPMLDQIMRLVSSLSDPIWIVTANTTLPDYADGSVISISPNLPQDVVGRVISWNDVLTIIEDQFGLRELTPDEIVEEPALEIVEELTDILSTLPTVPTWRGIPTYTTPLGEKIYTTLKTGYDKTLERLIRIRSIGNGN